MKKRGMTFWIVVGLLLGILVGIAINRGYLPPAVSKFLKMASTALAELFIRLIKMLVAPIIFSTLVVGLAGAGHNHIGRLLIKSLTWFWLASLVALVVGLATANLLAPGLGAVQTTAVFFKAPTATKTFFEQVVPTSAFAALAENAILQIVFFSVLFALSLSAIGEKGQPVLDALRGVAEAMFKMTDYVMRAAPIGVAAAMAAAVGEQGLGVMKQLAKLVGSLYLALVVFLLLHLVAMKLLTRMHLRRTFSALKEPLLLAFSTASSESALPKAMTAMERLGVPAHIVGFVLPAGYSFNLTGSTLYMSLAALFIAQATQVHLGISLQIQMMLTLLVASKGVAAVPRASLIVLASTCAQFGLKVEWIATILSVDAIMDMARTTVNVFGNCMAAAVVAKWEGQLAADAPLRTGQPLPDLDH